MDDVAVHTVRVAEKHFGELFEVHKKNGSTITIDLVNEVRCSVLGSRSPHPLISSKVTIIFIRIAIEMLFQFKVEDHPQFQLSQSKFNKKMSTGSPNLLTEELLLPSKSFSRFNFSLMTWISGYSSRHSQKL